MFEHQRKQAFQGVKNVGAVVAPAYGVLKRGDFDADGLIAVTRPTADDMDPVMILINSGQPLGVNERGQAVDPGPPGSLALVNGSPPLYGGLGTRTDQWYLQSGGTGFTCLSSVTGGAAVVKPGGNTIVSVVCGTGGTAGNVIGRTLTTA